MADFIRRVLKEVKSGRLAKAAAISLLVDYQNRAGSPSRPRLHPVLHGNTSTAAQRRFSSVLIGEEFFVKDHVIDGMPILPAVAGLEMAYAAVAQAVDLVPAGSCLRFSHVVWPSPFVVRGDGKSLDTTLTPGNDGVVAFEIHSGGNNGAERQVHCRGRAARADEQRPPARDIKALAAHFAAHPLPPSAWYREFERAGIRYGPAYRAIADVLTRGGDNGLEEVLARIALPACICDSQFGYTLHPALVDAALQAAAALLSATDNATRVPFSVDEVTVHAPCSATMWAAIRHSPDSRPGLPKLDIDMCDEQGRLCVQLGGYFASPADAAISAAPVPDDALTRQSSGNVATLLRQMLADLLDVNDGEIDPQARFEDFGLDQVQLNLLGQRLAEAFGTEAAAAIRQCETLQDLVAAIEQLAPSGRPLSGAPHAADRRPAPALPVDDERRRDKAVLFFKELLASASKLAVDRIDADAPFASYGLDSIMAMQMTDTLEGHFGALPKTLFFEFKSINDIADHFLENHGQRLAEIIAAREPRGKPVETKEVATTAAAPMRSVRKPRPASGVDPAPRSRAALDIAIIGLAGSYPGASDIAAFWRNLCDGVDSITEIPPERWQHSQFFDADANRPGKTYGKWGGFLDDVDKFDAEFFNISPREAAFMDPQERLFLQCVYHALQDAGYSRSLLAAKQRPGAGGKVAVFVGAMYQEYQLYGVQHTMLGQPVALSGTLSAIANRVSYFFDFNGPSVAVDTMCSSSLTAIHLACESLVHGTSKLAIAGGVNVSVHPNKYLLLAQGRFLSSNGRCMSFGEGGDGYVPGEGVGAALLKPLHEAIEDGDNIYAVIKGSAISHGGRTNGYSVPSPAAQASVIGEALDQAGIDARSIRYVEAHGTGTALGDPIEIAGLCKGFAAYTADKQFCFIGSAKSNIGHC